MEQLRLGVVESQFADIIWENAPLSTKELVALCAQRLNWKRTTTYTVLKKLCDRGIFATENGTVTVRYSKEEFHAICCEEFVNKNFKGSLPAFIAAFTTRKTLSEAELEQIKALVADIEESK